MTKKYVQLELTHGDSHRMAWVPHEKNIKVGNSIRMKGEEEFWLITSVSEHEVDEKNLHTDWNNNI